MWIVDWFKNKLQEIGWLGKKGKIVFLGLDDAGKTTLLKRLKEDKMAQMPPTLQPHAEQLMIGNVSVTAWDLGGHEAARKTWKNYFAGINAIIFLVDASKQERFEQARIQLEQILETESLSKVPIVILGNKIDKKEAVPEEQLRERLGIKQITDTNERAIQIFMCSIAKKIGYTDALKWVAKYLK